MDLRDVIVAPIIIILVMALGYFIRPLATDENTKRYFLPALVCKMFGALFLGFLYQFYYEGGDTFNYHAHGSRVIWEAFVDAPDKGIDLLFSSGKPGPGLWSYAENIWYFRDQKAFFIVRIATLLDFLTFSSYAGTAVLFSVLSFIGAWLFYLTFYDLKPSAHKSLAIACLFIPSALIWSSGILKDTITTACLGMATYCFYKLFIQLKFSVLKFTLLALCIFVIFTVKKYILISFFPALLAWAFAIYFGSIRSAMVRITLMPFVIISCLALAYVAINEATRDDPKYALEKIGETARVTAYDIRYWTGKDAGSGYSLGELDGSFGSMISLAPAAIIVSLFRPYIWEVQSPIMLLSALESFCFLLYFIYTIGKCRLKFFSFLTDPTIMFCLVFVLIFSFAVGVSTFNFGTLARYKVPLIPYFVSFLALLNAKMDEVRQTRPSIA